MGNGNMGKNSYESRASSSSSKFNGDVRKEVEDGWGM